MLNMKSKNMTVSNIANKLNTENSDDNIDEENCIQPNSSEGSEDENLSKNEESDNSSENIDDTDGTNLAWADSIAKILKTKKPKNKRSLVLSKAKKLTDVKKEKPEEIGFQIEGEIKEEKLDVDKLTKLIEKSCEPPEKKRKELPNIRVKPNILDKDREKTLAKIATRGVVQLFNSVRMQQKDIDTKLEKAGPLERKRENVLKSIDKRAFLDVLMQKKSQSVDGNVKDEVKHESKKPTWSVLRDDFMMSTKLKDWDKEMEEDTDNFEQISDSN